MEKVQKVVLYNVALHNMHLTYYKTLLTLIGPGEVKVHLANFDLKLQENLLSNLI
jgi:hypothetical protein